MSSPEGMRPYTLEELDELQKELQDGQIFLTPQSREKARRLIYTAVLCAPRDDQEGDRMEKLAEAVHQHAQEIIRLKRELQRERNRVEQLQAQPHVPLLPTGGLEIKGDGEMLDLRGQTTPEMQGAVLRLKEEELPVENVPLSAALSPENAPEVPQDPPAPPPVSSKPPRPPRPAPRWQREYYCKLVLSIIDSGLLNTESDYTYTDAVHRRADMLLTQARQRFGEKP
jgi:hypothetical protein